MKTTLELDDDLLAEAKAVAARRRITLKAMVEHALRREMAPVYSDRSARFAPGALGLPRLQKRGAANPNAELHRRLSEGDVEDAIAWLDRGRGGRKARP